MKLFKKVSKKQPLSRRELVASRRAANESQSSSHQAYRRSRTIGSRQKSVGVSDRQVSIDLRTKRRKVLSGLGVSLAASAGVFALLSQLTASVVVTAPNQSQITAEVASAYTKVFDEYLSTRPLERLRFMLDTGALQLYFLEHAPEIQSAEVLYGGSVATSNLRLSFRQPTLKWAAAGNNYYVDGQGVTFERNYFDEPTLGVEDKSGVEPEVGQAVIDYRFLRFLGQVSAEFATSNVTVSRIILPESTIRQVDFGIEGKGYVVRMTVDRGVLEQTRRAVRSMEFLSAQGIAPTYIDARVDQRVFYK